MDFKDYYEVLGIDKAAGADAVKKAFRKLARKFHPDVSKEADASARMSAVNEAYTVLSDPEKRAAYDDLAARRRAGQDFQPPSDWGSGFEFTGRGGAGADPGGVGSADFSEFFESLFGRARAARGGFGPGNFEAAAGGGPRRGACAAGLADRPQAAPEGAAAFRRRRPPARPATCTSNCRWCCRRPAASVRASCMKRWPAR